MKAKLITLAFFFSSFLMAQDYLPVPLDTKMYFNADFFDMGYQYLCEFEGCVIGTRVDSVKDNGGIMEYYFPKILRGDFMLCEGAPWLGEKLRLQPNGDQIYRNKNNWAITLEPYVDVNEVWVMYDYQDGTYIEATLKDRYEEDVLGVLDTVVRIEMIHKDANGDIVSNDLNGKEVLLGKSTGFIETYNFYQFPEAVTPILLIGYSDQNTQHGQVPPTAADIFNFQVGNEYHRIRQDESIFPPFYWSKKYEAIKILEKTVAANGDSLIYLIEREIFFEESGSGGSSETYTVDTVPLIYNLEAYQHLNLMPFEGFSNFYSGIITNHLQDGRLLVRSHPYYAYDGSTGCFEEYIGIGVVSKLTYGDCIGSFTSYWSDGYDYENLVYYKKDSEEWGTPIDFDALTTIREVLLPDHTFEVIPNPASTWLSISANEFFDSEIEIEIVSLDGRLLSSEVEYFAGQLEIQLPNHASGLHVLKIKTDQGLFVKKIVLD